MVARQQTREDRLMEITSVGTDLGKTAFHLVVLSQQGKVVVRKKFSRQQQLSYAVHEVCRGEKGRKNGQTAYRKT
jgi:hypothetical protein